ncbi:MAG: hypothetical protein PHE54_01450 [Bacilli bacterium]|nr:hypothetical protein [Bacilli bacterium]
MVRFHSEPPLNTNKANDKRPLVFLLKQLYLMFYIYFVANITFLYYNELSIERRGIYE